MVELRRFVEPVLATRLPGLLHGDATMATEAVGYSGDLTEVSNIVTRMAAAGVGSGGPQRSVWDAELAGPLHRALRHLPRGVTLDMRFWHWLATVRCPDFVWLRWHGRIPGDPSVVLTDALIERFLGSRSLHGVSRNGFARLYFCADTLYSEKEGYVLVQQALSNQDFFQAIFEREFGLYPPAARACLKVLGEATEEARRDAVRRLNHYLTTTVIEALAEDEIAQLLTG